MSAFSRREFLDRSAILAAAAAVGTPHLRAAAAPDTKAGSANDRLRVAVVGVKGRGMNHVSGFAGKNNCVITTICDCDEGVIGNAMKKTEEAQKVAPKFVKDIRKLIDDKDIDVISIATPNHWHSLMAAWAIRAGKDVYVEKPVSHNVKEGRIVVNLARKHNKIVQTGTQSRSNPGMRQAIDYVHSGKIGKVQFGYATCYKPRKSIGKVTAPTAPPKGMDYDLWCGPARVLPVTRKGLHYDWHWTWEYGNGDLGNQGIHEMDKARWGLGQKELPSKIVSVGGRFGYVDDGETANSQICHYTFADKNELIFEVRGLETKAYKGSTVGNIWFGSEGYVVCPSYSSGIAYDKDGKKVAEFKGGGDQSHFDNFVTAVRSRKVTDLNADILEGHLSSAMCHLGNISYRLGKETTADKFAEAFAGHKDGTEAAKRMAEHLKDNKIDLGTAVGRAGVPLVLDPKTETFADNKAANDMLFREYRKGFDISETV